VMSRKLFRLLLAHLAGVRFGLGNVLLAADL
jgi:hypothetical protein